MNLELDIEYRGHNTKESDFDSFWYSYVNQVINHDPCVNLTKTAYKYNSKVVEKISFFGLDGTPIHGWYIHDVSKRNDTVIVTTHGYRSSRKTPNSYLHWLDVSTDVIALDMRLQGGETGCYTQLQAPFYGEVVTINIMDINNSYLLMMYTDMMVATRVSKFLGYKHYILEGASQAGGLAVAVGCLMNDALAVLANVPSNSDLDQRIIEGKGSFKDFQKMAYEQPSNWNLILKNVSYFDTKNMADRLSSPLLASVGGMDEVCPPRSFYATYNRIQSDKRIILYPFNGHEGGSSYQTEQEMSYILNLDKRCDDENLKDLQ